MPGPNLVTNGGFETGDFTGWTVSDPEPQNPDIGVDSQPLDVNSGAYGVFAGNETSTLTQSISTVAGHTYTVSFYLDVYQSTAYEGAFIANFTGVAAVDLFEPGETDAFVEYSAQVTATSASSLLQFVFDDPGGYFGLDDVSVTDNACFCIGTRILTDKGERAVEDLAIGDLVVLVSGETAPIRWIGRRKIVLNRHPRPDLVRPVRIEAGALGENLPVRDLIVSPEHALWLEDRLVTARSLINGATIRQEAWSWVEYFHVELDTHEILIAEGVAAESYLDCDNRSGFENAPGGVVMLHPDWSQRAARRAFASRAQQARLRAFYAARAAQRGRDEEIKAFEARGQATRTNFVRNPRAEGATVGAIGQGGEAPLYWWLNAPEGIAVEILAASEEEGLPCLDLRFAGTASARGHCVVYFETGATATVAAGEDWTVSCQMRLIEGGLEGIESVHLYVDENGADGGYLTGDYFLQTTPTNEQLSLQPMTATYRISRPDAVATTGYVRLTASAGADVDFTLRVAAPQIEQGSYASDPILPPAGQPQISRRDGAILVRQAA